MKVSVTRNNTDRLICYPLLHRNTTYPARKSFHGGTSHGGQKIITFRLFEGEHLESEKNQALGTMRLEGIRQSPKGVEQVDGAITVNEKGIISVSATYRRTGKSCSIQLIKPHQLTPQELSEKGNIINRLRKAGIPSDYLTSAACDEMGSIIDLKPIGLLNKRAKIGKRDDGDDNFCPVYGQIMTGYVADGDGDNDDRNMGFESDGEFLFVQCTRTANSMQIPFSLVYKINLSLYF